ncbi:MAG: DDE transposase family protein [Microcoleus sp.]
MTAATGFYIVKRPAGTCEIIPSDRFQTTDTAIVEKWGPYDSAADAIARRVGLIRAGKCQPQ